MIWRPGVSELSRSPRKTSTRPVDEYMSGVVAATTSTVAVVAANRPRISHLRRNSTARNSRVLAWRSTGAEPGAMECMWTPASGIVDHVGGDEHAVEVEQLPAHQRGGQRGLGAAEQLLHEHGEVADRVARHVDDVEPPDRDVLELVALDDAVHVDPGHPHGAGAVAVQHQHAAARGVVLESARGGDRLHHRAERPRRHRALLPHPPE